MVRRRVVLFRVMPKSFYTRKEGVLVTSFITETRLLKAVFAVNVIPISFYAKFRPFRTPYAFSRRTEKFAASRCRTTVTFSVTFTRSRGRRTTRKSTWPRFWSSPIRHTRIGKFFTRPIMEIDTVSTSPSSGMVQTMVTSILGSDVSRLPKWSSINVAWSLTKTTSKISALVIIKAIIRPPIRPPLRPAF